MSTLPMLSGTDPDQPEDEDEHMCIRCRQSFVGLENYILHRKGACSKLKTSSFGRDEAETLSDSALTLADAKSDFLTQVKNKSKDVITSQKYEWNFDRSFSKPSVSSDVLDSIMTGKTDLEPRKESTTGPSKSFLEKESSVYSDRARTNKLLNKVNKDLVRPSSGQSSSDHFTRLYDPLFNNNASVSSFIKSIENLTNNTKFHGLPDPQSLFSTKDGNNAFDLETQGFDQRYSDLYGSLTTNANQDLEPTPSTSQKKVRDLCSNTSKLLKENERIKMQSPDLSDNTATYISAPPEMLKQDDFLSSLELSSVKLLHEKRKYGTDDEDDEDDEDGDDNRPPSHHTGGKWRPGMMPPPPNVGEKWRPFSPNINDERSELEDAFESDFTSGSNINLVLGKSEKCSRPPVYTKGKWLPGKQPGENLRRSFVHHCEPCNAEFRTKASYKRHLDSKIHARIALDLNSYDVDEPEEKPIRSEKLKAQSFLKRTIENWKKKRPIASTKPSFSVSKKAETSKMLAKEPVVSGLEPEVGDCCEADVELSSIQATFNPKSSQKMKCPICRLSFVKAYLANHFASLAHIHNELEYKRNLETGVVNEQDQIVLENMNTLIVTCHFHCQQCKFYCNEQEHLNLHLGTHDQHLKSLDNDMTVRFNCSACPDESSMTNSEIQRHMVTPAHFMAVRDTILSAQKVLVTTVRSFVCNICQKNFRLYRQYEDHRQKHHKQTEFKLSSRTPRLCPICSYRGHSCKQVRQHIRSTHDIIGHYICFLCGTMHETSEEARLHRFSREHRLKAGLEQGGKRHCRMCYFEFDSLEILREHLDLEHKQHCAPCVKCGLISVSSGDLKAHQAVCDGQIQAVGYRNKCELCDFSSPLLAHVLLHTTIVHGEKSGDRHLCHVCQKSLKYMSLRSHMLYHTCEFPHQCRQCSRSFPHQSWLERHELVAHANSESSSAGEKSLCQVCGITCSSRVNLTRHLESKKCSGRIGPTLKKVPTRTSQRCLDPGSILPELCGIMCELCGEQTQTLQAMKMHMKAHREAPNSDLRCLRCPYKTGSLPHLRRHLRLHSGAKPYKCPYCSYSANDQGNLRRHFKSKKHPGRCLYECKFCIEDHLSSTKKQQSSTSPHLRESNLDEQSEQLPEPLVDCIDNRWTKSARTGGTQTETFRDERKLEQHDVDKDVSGPAQSSLQKSVREVFKTDFAVNFRQHLEEEHSDKFATSAEVMRLVRSYYHPEDDMVTYEELENNLEGFSESEEDDVEDSGLEKNTTAVTEDHGSSSREDELNAIATSSGFQQPALDKTKKIKQPRTVAASDSASSAMPASSAIHKRTEHKYSTRRQSSNLNSSSLISIVAPKEDINENREVIRTVSSPSSALSLIHTSTSSPSSASSLIHTSTSSPSSASSLIHTSTSSRSTKSIVGLASETLDINYIHRKIKLPTTSQAHADITTNIIQTTVSSLKNNVDHSTVDTMYSPVIKNVANFNLPVGSSSTNCNLSANLPTLTLTSMIPSSTGNANNSLLVSPFIDSSPMPLAHTTSTTATVNWPTLVSVSSSDAVKDGGQFSSMSMIASSSAPKVTQIPILNYGVVVNPISNVYQPFCLPFQQLAIPVTQTAVIPNANNTIEESSWSNPNTFIHPSSALVVPASSSSGPPHVSSLLSLPSVPTNVDPSFSTLYPTLHQAATPGYLNLPNSGSSLQSPFLGMSINLNPTMTSVVPLNVVSHPLQVRTVHQHSLQPQFSFVTMDTSTSNTFSAPVSTPSAFVKPHSSTLIPMIQKAHVDSRTTSGFHSLFPTSSSSEPLQILVSPAFQSEVDPQRNTLVSWPATSRTVAESSTCVMPIVPAPSSGNKTFATILKSGDGSTDIGNANKLSIVCKRVRIPKRDPSTY